MNHARDQTRRKDTANSPEGGAYVCGTTLVFVRRHTELCRIFLSFMGVTLNTSRGTSRRHTVIAAFMPRRHESNYNCRGRSGPKIRRRATRRQILELKGQKASEPGAHGRAALEPPQKASSSEETQQAENPSTAPTRPWAQIIRHNFQRVHNSKTNTGKVRKKPARTEHPVYSLMYTHSSPH
jgi:hypothetical protein